LPANKAAQQGWCEVINIENKLYHSTAEQCINLGQQPQKLQHMHQQSH